MRTLAVGDIHGCTTAFDKLLEAVELRPEDKLITLGDQVDKGPDSKGVLERLVYLHENYQLVPIKGNHEVMMLDAFNGRDNNNFWVNVSGKATLVSSYKTPSLTAEFKNNQDSLSNIPDQYLTFVKNHCLDWDETETHIFVHANVDPDLPLHKQSDHDLFWQKLYPRPSHYSGKIVVCGHTSQKDGYPVNMGHQICIDTWACGRGWLTCLDVDTGEIWQTNQKGKLLTGNINNCSNVSIN